MKWAIYGRENIKKSFRVKMNFICINNLALVLIHLKQCFMNNIFTERNISNFSHIK